MVAKSLWSVALLIVAAGMAGTVYADQGEKNGGQPFLCQSNGICCTPGCYCRKPMPCAQCPDTCGLSVQYCCKPMPCVQCPETCGVSVPYCCKPMPICWPPRPMRCRCCRAAGQD